LRGALLIRVGVVLDPHGLRPRLLCVRYEGGWAWLDAGASEGFAGSSPVRGWRGRDRGGCLAVASAHRLSGQSVAECARARPRPGAQVCVLAAVRRETDRRIAAGVVTDTCVTQSTRLRDRRRCFSGAGQPAVILKTAAGRCRGIGMGTSLGPRAQRRSRNPTGIGHAQGAVCRRFCGRLARRSRFVVWPVGRGPWHADSPAARGLERIGRPGCYSRTVASASPGLRASWSRANCVARATYPFRFVR
jgi:hypothetical protein